MKYHRSHHCSSIPFYLYRQIVVVVVVSGSYFPLRESGCGSTNVGKKPVKKQSNGMEVSKDILDNVTIFCFPRKVTFKAITINNTIRIKYCNKLHIPTIQTTTNQITPKWPLPKHCQPCELNICEL